MDQLRNLGNVAANACASSWRGYIHESFSSLALELIVAGRARFSVSTKLLKSWIKGHYRERILAALEAEIGGVVALEVSVRTPNSTLAARTAKSDPRLQSPATDANGGATSKSTPMSDPAGRRNSSKFESKGFWDALAGSPLDRRLNFSSFLVGRANQLDSRRRSVRARDVQAGAHSQPAIFHASVGLGKTHLLQAIAHAATAQGRSVVYLTAEKFMYGFVAALQAQTAIAFKEALRAIDLLIFDDAQFLQGKVIQAEFGHALNALVDAGRQVVVAADRPPGELEALEERVRSRLAGGLCVEMHPLDEPLRVKILEARIAAARLQNPTSKIVGRIGVRGPFDRFERPRSRGRGQPSGGAFECRRPAPHSRCRGVAIRDLIRSRKPKRVKIEDIQKLVAIITASHARTSCPRGAPRSSSSRVRSRCIWRRRSRCVRCRRSAAASADAITPPCCTRCARSRVSVPPTRPCVRNSNYSSACCRSRRRRR